MRFGVPCLCTRTLRCHWFVGLTASSCFELRNLLLDVFPQQLDAVLELIAGIRHLVAVEDHVRGKENDELGPGFPVGVRAKQRPEKREAVQPRDSRQAGRGAFLDLAADRYGVAVLNSN